MAMAGVDKWLTPAEIEAICQHYTAPKTAMPSMDVMAYTQFLADVDQIFTKPVRAAACAVAVMARALLPTALWDKDVSTALGMLSGGNG